MMEQMNKEVFEYCWEKYVDKHPGGFMEENYGWQGKIASPLVWATCYNYSTPRTSMVAESYHRYTVILAYTHISDQDFDMKKRV